MCRGTYKLCDVTNEEKNTQNKFEINSESVLIYKSDFVMLVRILTQPVFS